MNPIADANRFSVDLSQLIVIGVSGRIGSGASFVRDKILQSLRTFKYDVDIIDVTDMMESLKKTLGEDELKRIKEQVDSNDSVQSNDKAKRIRELQLTGNSFRKEYGNSILAAFCITEFIIPDLEEREQKFQSRKAYVIDSLKHPDEVRLFRQIFGTLFWQVGVVASDVTRLDRLKQRKRFDRSTFEYISEEDADGRYESDNDRFQKNGQRTIDAVLESDYFFANDFSTKDEIESEAARLIKLVFGVQIVSPTTDEFGMQAAYQASLRSACLSRQVGASILAQDGEILSTGHNDVPKFGGGLYGPVPSNEDKRCWAWGGKCYNDEEKSKITRDVIDVLIKHDFINEDDKEKAVATLSASRIKALIEFTRAVHAEMEAMLSLARVGVSGIVGSTLYTTTYPCHNCAKHIVDAGIHRVVFLEPYEKSLARALHPDAISDPLEQRTKTKVGFDNFGGISPRRFNDVFKPAKKRKIDGIFADEDRSRHALLPIKQEEADTLQQRLGHLQIWVDRKLAPKSVEDNDREIKIETPQSESSSRQQGGDVLDE